MDTERLLFLAGFAIGRINDVRIRRQDMEIERTDNPPMVVAIYFNCPDGQRKEFIQTWAKGVLEALEKARELLGLNMDTTILLELSLKACGGQATYRTADDVPLVDVPCPCGDINHWLVKWSKTE